MTIFVRINRYFLQSFNKFGKLGSRKKIVCATRKIWKETFSKFELKNFVLNFEKILSMPPEGNGKNVKINFEIWKYLAISPGGNEKKLKYATKNWKFSFLKFDFFWKFSILNFEIIFFENFHFWILEWKFLFEIWFCFDHITRGKWKKSYISFMPPIKLPIIPLYHI
jgi:hypothetical protein